MLTNDRRNKIQEIIISQGSVRVTDLAKTLNVSKETIRKDLQFLHDGGLIIKEFGGATASSEVVERPVYEREKENPESKISIVRYAQSLIPGNNVIFVDAGSTLFYFTKYMASDLNLTVITNSFRAVDLLVDSHNIIYFIGGEISNNTMSTFGLWAEQTLGTIKIDIAFLGTSGFQSCSGPTCKHFSDAQFKKHVVEKSAKNIVLADSSKFSSSAIVQFASWSDIDLLITDSNVQKDSLSQLRNLVEVVTVDI